MMKRNIAVLIALLLGVVLLTAIFHAYFSGERVLLSTDAMISHSNVSFVEMLQGIAPRWRSVPLIGSPRGGGTSVSWISRGFFSTGILWNNLFYGVVTLVSFLLLSICFLRRKLSFPAVLCGSIAALWLGTNFTLIYPGHAHKPVVILFFICSLLPVSRAAAGSVIYALIWGACVGIMFVQQPDIALFFALPAGAYLLFRLWTCQGFKPVQWLKVLGPALVLAFIFAVGPLLTGYEIHVKGASQMQSQDPQEKWNYVTQWSLPPDELIDFVAPGYFGWRSGEPEGPYWGRMGRSPDWEQTRQGFQNFKLESTYIGLIPIGFALFALFACRRSRHRPEILFWAIAAAVTLMLSFGKYFPLYTLFYKLPVVNNIRNPNKFIQVFQVCTAILAAYGFDILWRSGTDEDKTNAAARPIRVYFWASVGMLAILVMTSLVMTLGQQESAARFVMEGWSQDAAHSIVQVRAASLRHASFMAALLTAVFAVFRFGKLAPLLRYRNAIAVLLVLVVAGDAVRLSKHYVKEMPRSYIETNALTNFLQDNLGDQRIAFVSQQGIDNIWITYLMPYNGIASFNFTDMPRMANDYTALLTAGQRNPLNLWRFSAVKYVLGAASLESQLTQAGCRKVFSYGLSDAGNGEFNVIQSPNGPYAVYELSGSLPRYELFAGSRKAPDQQALSGALSDFDRVYIPEDSTMPVLSGSGRVGEVEVLSSRPGKVRLKVVTGIPAILRAAEKYTPDWKATIDGRPADLGRVDFICQGVAIPPGEHEVQLRYAPARGFFYLQCAGLGILCGALIIAAVRRKAIHAPD